MSKIRCCFFAAVAAGIVLTWYRDAGSATHGGALAAAGFYAGLAGACKYTGLVFVAAALFATFALTLRPALRSISIRRFLAPIATCYLLGVTLGIGPWLARNTAFTGNPVYPFAYDWFGGRGWSDEQNAKWKAGHNLRGAENGFIGRFEGRRRAVSWQRDRQGRPRSDGATSGCCLRRQFWGW